MKLGLNKYEIEIHNLHFFTSIPNFKRWQMLKVSTRVSLHFGSPKLHSKPTILWPQTLTYKRTYFIRKPLSISPNVWLICKSNLGKIRKLFKIKTKEHEHKSLCMNLFWKSVLGTWFVALDCYSLVALFLEHEVWLGWPSDVESGCQSVHWHQLVTPVSPKGLLVHTALPKNAREVK